jgi:hypothetical protein
MAEVHQQAEAVAGRLEAVIDLGTMGVVQVGHCLDLQDDLVEADKVREIGLLQGAARVPDGQARLRPEGDSLEP